MVLDLYYPPLPSPLPLYISSFWIFKYFNSAIHSCELILGRSGSNSPLGFSGPIPALWTKHLHLQIKIIDTVYLSNHIHINTLLYLLINININTLLYLWIVPTVCCVIVYRCLYLIVSESSPFSYFYTWCFCTVYISFQIIFQLYCGTQCNMYLYKCPYQCCTVSLSFILVLCVVPAELLLCCIFYMDAVCCI